MKKSPFLLVIILSIILFISNTNAQSNSSFAKFSEEPSKRIHSLHLESTNFFIEYQSKKKATIYINLIKNGKVYATTHEVIKSKERTITKFNFDKSPLHKIIPGNGYKLQLVMYEGESNNYKKLITDIIVKDINLSRLDYTKL